MFESAQGTVLCVRYGTLSRTMERVALPGKAEGGIPGDRKFGVRVSFFNGSNFVNSVYESFDPDCGSDWQYVSAAAVALVTYSCKILNLGGSLASTLGIQNPFRYRGYVYDQHSTGASPLCACAKDSKKSSKERAIDKPSWANRESVDPNLSAQQNATEM